MENNRKINNIIQFPEASFHGPLPVICLGGPTGCGKTGLAVEIGRRIGAEIINADSRQVYRDFPVVTAQPTMEERGGIPHHLYGFLDSNEKISAGHWSRLACEKAAEILSRGKMPLLVGGTGFYFQTILRGIAQIPPIPDEISQNLLMRLRAGERAALFAHLQSIDPLYAARLHPNDSQRILRALEVWEGTGKTFSWWHENKNGTPLCYGPLIIIDEHLATLEPRLLRRIDVMLENGAVEEARLALGKCPQKNAPAWNGIGCAELHALLHNETDIDECRRLWFRNTRSYAKRQRTWFHGRKEAVFIASGMLESALDIAVTFCSNFPDFSLCQVE